MKTSLKLYMVEANEKDWDCYESFLVLASDVKDAQKVALNYLDKEIMRWGLKDNFREYGYSVKLVTDLDTPRVVHSNYRSG